LSTEYFLVKREHGPSWDASRLRREQRGWDAHAAFMDKLVEEGAIVLGGPVGEGDGDHTVIVFDAGSEAGVRALLTQDPWGEDMLRTASIEPWTIFLQRSPG
jgi:uncharacterized protein YciI